VGQHITECTQSGAFTTLQWLFVWYDDPRDTRRQCAVLLAVWRRFRQKWPHLPAVYARSALYAKPAGRAMDAGFRQLLNFPRGVVVQLVRTLHCHVCPINLTLSFELRAPPRALGNRIFEASLPCSLIHTPKITTVGLAKGVHRSFRPFP